MSWLTHSAAGSDGLGAVVAVVVGESPEYVVHLPASEQTSMEIWRDWGLERPENSEHDPSYRGGTTCGEPTLSKRRQRLGRSLADPASVSVHLLLVHHLAQNLHSSRNP